MKLLKGYSDDKEFDIFELTDKIDDLFHEYITDFNGCTISHSTINRFVLTIVNDINSNIQLQRNVFDRVVEYERLEREEIKKQVAAGKVVLNLETVLNRLKYKHFCYVLDTEQGGVLYKGV